VPYGPIEIASKQTIAERSQYLQEHICFAPRMPPKK